MTEAASSILIIAAEASSSLYAQRLLERWRGDGRKIRAFGIGNRDMEKLGFECIGRSEEMAVVGVQEVVKHLPLIRRVYKALLREAEVRKPAVALLMDYPEFNLKIAKDLRKRGIKVVYYISPQIWAWRTGRVHLIKRIVDKMLVLFPFEVDFYKGHGVPVTFVGHPLLDELPADESSGDRRTHRERFGIQDDEIVLGLMPGSRRSEIAHHLETQLRTAELVVRANPKVRPILMVAPTLEREELRAGLASAAVTVQMVKENPVDMIKLADVVLVASGTATLMVGLLAKPMVIMYRMNALTAWLAKKLVTKTPFFGMANLILGRRAVPELFQEEANPKRLAEELLKLANSTAERSRVEGELRELRDRLGSKGATARVDEALAEYL